MLKCIQVILFPEIAFSEAAKRHDNISHSDCNENDDIDGWSSIIIQLITFALLLIINQCMTSS